MIPRIAKGGRSFKGSHQYLMHDKDQMTRERVEWTHTENMLTDDPDKAWKIMAYTALESERLKEASGQKATGRKLEKPVLHYSLAWHPEQSPDREHMLETARRSLDTLGLSEHEALVIAHRDEPQKHVHVVVNRVHPETGLTATISHSKRKLSDFAREYERADGRIYCEQREDNHQRQQNGENTMYRDQIIQGAWNNSDSGKSFGAALNAEGYKLANGRKRTVVVDRYGKVHNPLRHLEGVKARALQERVKDLANLPDATKLSESIQTENRKRYDASLQHDEWSSKKQAKLQDHHLEQTARVSDEHHKRKLREQDRMDASYKLNETKKAIKENEQKILKPPIWKRVLGITRRDKQRLEELKANFESARHRYDERMKHLEQQRETALAQLKRQQTNEKENNHNQSLTTRPEGYLTREQRRAIDVNQPKPERSRERSRGSGYGR